MTKKVAWLWFAAVLGAFFADRAVVLWVSEWAAGSEVGTAAISGLWWTGLRELMVFLTDYGMLFALILFAVALFEKGVFKQLLLVGLAFAVSLEVSYLLKELFMVPRPYETWGIVPLKTAEGFSFPSMHTAFIFSALPFLGGGWTGRVRGLVAGWWTLAILVAVSRVYVGAHYLSDVLAGAGIGYAVGWAICSLEEKYGLTTWLMGHLKDRFEVRRQAAHALIGLLIVTLYYLNLISAGVVLAVLVAGGMLCVVAGQAGASGGRTGRWRLWGLSALLRKILAYFERPEHRRAFPGSGSFFMVLGCLLAMLLFEKSIALAAMTIMALGDSVTHVFGRYFGEVKLPYNSRKTLDGALMGVIAATLGAFFFVPFHVALVGSLAAIFVETLDLRVGFVELDDNILVPLVAGAVMGLL